MRSTQRTLSLLLLFAAAAASHGAVVQTSTERLNGKVSFDRGALRVSGKNILWRDVILMVADPSSAAFPPPQTVRLKNGEVWPATMVTVEEGKLSLSSKLLGKRTIPISTVASIDFRSGLSGTAHARKGVLYREKGEPLPGKLLWLDTTHIAIDSALGVLKLQRKGLLRYRCAWESRRPPGDNTDVITLIDGAIYRGQSRPETRTLEMQHKQLGNVSIPVTALKTLVRHTNRTRFLTDALPKLQKTFPLLDEKAVRPRVTRLASDRDGAWARALQIEPKSLVRWSQPTQSGLSASFRTVVRPMPNCRGQAHVKLMVNGKTVFDRKLGRQDRPVPVSVALPAGKAFDVAVDFGNAPFFPCGVVLEDPHLVLGRP